MKDNTQRAAKRLVVSQQFSEARLVADIHRIRDELGLPKIDDHLDALVHLQDKTPELFLRLVEAEQALRVAYLLLNLDPSDVVNGKDKPLHHLKDIWLERFTRESSQYKKVGAANRARKQELSQTLRACIFLAYCQFSHDGIPQVGWQRLKTRARQIGAFNRVVRDELDLLTRARIEPFLRAFRQIDALPSLSEICSLYNLSMP
jgi:hypothetical protein